MPLTMGTVFNESIGILSSNLAQDKKVHGGRVKIY